MNKKEAVSHYETQARAALYPELVKALQALLIAGNGVDTEKAESHARALLSRLPAERDKGAG